MVHWKGGDSLQCASLLSGFVSGISEDIYCICRSGLCHLGVGYVFRIYVVRGYVSFRYCRCIPTGGEHCTISGRHSKPQPDGPKRIIKLNLLFLCK